MPWWEVVTGPVEDSANGKLVFPSLDGFGRIEFKFKNGRVIEANGKKSQAFWKKLKQATGEKDRIAEFAIGLNPGVPDTSEKALGSIHIAIGKNNHIGGKSESSLHWDMIINKPTIKANGKLIMNAGAII